MTDIARIAIIEDNNDLREELVFFLQSRGHQVWGRSSAESFWKQLHRSPADIVLIDVGLPGEDGFSVLEYLKTLGQYGLIIITARGSRDDKMRGLNLGADQYLVKPVNFSDLANSVAALWQRLKEQPGVATAAHNPKTSSNWRLNEDRHSLCSPDGIELVLTSQEYKLIETLYRHRNEVCKKEMLHDLLFAYDNEPDTHRVDVILNRLRTKARQQNMQLPVRAIFGKGLVLIADA